MWTPCWPSAKLQPATLEVLLNADNPQATGTLCVTGESPDKCRYSDTFSWGWGGSGPRWLLLKHSLQRLPCNISFSGRNDLFSSEPTSWQNFIVLKTPWILSGRTYLDTKINWKPPWNPTGLWYISAWRGSQGGELGNRKSRSWIIELWIWHLG